jgi:hypothetical protein
MKPRRPLVSLQSQVQFAQGRPKSQTIVRRGGEKLARMMVRSVRRLS